MRGNIITAIFCFFVGQLFAQSADSANDLFDNFEYEEAIVVFEEANKDSELNNADKEKLAFCYYITANHKDGLPFINSIMKEDDDRSHFWLWKGTLEKESGDYENSIVSLKTFKKKTAYLSEEVDIMIKSCELIPTWDSLERHSAASSELNNKLANSYSTVGNNLWLYEVGIDSLGNMKTIDDSKNSYSEMFLMRPVVEAEGTIQQIRLFENFPNLSVNRIQLIERTNKLIFSASDPLSKNNILRAPQIYIADYASMDKPLEEINLWEYSGTTDTSSCSHPAISHNGTFMVFAKSSATTEGSDLYLSVNSGGNWGVPNSISHLNTFGNEMFPMFLDESTLTFSTDGRVGYGGLDIFSVNYDSDKIYTDISHIHAPINSPMDDYNLSWQDSLNGNVVSNRFGGKGDDDIWNITIEPEEIIIVEVPDGFKEWYEEWNLKPIYFDFDSFEAEANQAFIDGCIKYREKYGVDVKLIGHTDSRGKEKYNMNLGLNRSNWLKEQLVKANVLNVISTESVGETQLVNECGSSSKCSEEEHQLNRFVEIQISANQDIPE